MLSANQYEEQYLQPLALPGDTQLCKALRGIGRRATSAESLAPSVARASVCYPSLLAPTVQRALAAVHQVEDDARARQVAQAQAEEQAQLRAFIFEQWGLELGKPVRVLHKGALVTFELQDVEREFDSQSLTLRGQRLTKAGSPSQSRFAWRVQTLMQARQALDGVPPPVSDPVDMSLDALLQELQAYSDQLQPYQRSSWDKTLHAVLQAASPVAPEAEQALQFWRRRGADLHLREHILRNENLVWDWVPSPQAQPIRLLQLPLDELCTEGSNRDPQRYGPRRAPNWARLCDLLVCAVIRLFERQVLWLNETYPGVSLEMPLSLAGDQDGWGNLYVARSPVQAGLRASQPL